MRAAWLTVAQGCPPLEPAGTGVACPDPVGQAGGIWPILVIVGLAAGTVAITFVLVPRLNDVGKRFLTLVGVVYVMAGLVSVTVINALIGVSLQDMASDPMPFVLQILFWPGLLASHLAGSYGR